MKITILPKTGIQESEKYAVDRIGKELPSEWRGYASLEIIEKGKLGREIDLLILTPDRVLLVELKRWNGQIKSEDGYWFLKRPSGTTFERKDRSPVKKNNDKARILKGIIERTIKGGQSILVDSRVVLCGNSPSPILSEDEKPFVLQLDEFIKIKDAAAYKRILPLPDAWKKNGWVVPSPLQQLTQFELLILRSSHVRAKEFSWQNYKVDGQEIFKHPTELYREYKAVNVDDHYAKALLRRWDFTRLGTAASTQADWVNIAHRESRVYSFVKSQTDELNGTLLQPIGSVSADEVTSDYCELFELPVKQKRLYEFIEVYRDKLPFIDKVALVKVLISKFAELHKLGVAHRDIGDHCIWLERPQSIRLSGFVAAYFPRMETVGAIRENVSAITTKLPEDFFEDKNSTPFHRDVFLLGVVAYLLLFGEQPPKDEGLPKWGAATSDESGGKLDFWFERALSWVTKDRWQSAIEMLDALNDVQLSRDEDVVPLSAFDYFQSKTKVSQYEELEVPIEKEGAEIIRASYAGQVCQLKVWYGLKPERDNPQLNHALLYFLEKAKSIQFNPCEWLPKVVDVGFNNRGLLFSREWLDASTLDEWRSANPPLDERLALSVNLLEGLSRIHSIQIHHGDIHPANILVPRKSEGAAYPRVVFIDTPDFKSGSPEVVTTAYAPANYEHLSLAERDRFAAVAVITEILDGQARPFKAGSYQLPEVYSELAGCLQSQPSILTVEHLRELLQQALLPPKPEENNYVITLARIPTGISEGKVLPDNGHYYIEAAYRDANHDEIFLIGPGVQLKIISNTETHEVKSILAEKITHSYFQRRARKSHIQITGAISILQGAANEADDLITVLYQMPELVSAINRGGKAVKEFDADSGVDDEGEKQRTDIPTRSIWKNLIEAEIDALPELVISGSSREHPVHSDILLVPYMSNVVIEYASDEEVDVYQESNSGEPKKVAMLEHKFTNGTNIALRDRSMSLKTSLGAKLTLQSKRDRSSYVRRQEAIERILQGRSIIQKLVGYFDKLAKPDDVLTYQEPSDEDIAQFDIFEGDRRIFSLNEDQKLALKKLISKGPISLLQGPPGTGKTDFIAAFLHYVVSKQGAQSVLLVSQSHEATNNALERALDLAGRTGLKLDVVRVGEDGMLSEPIKHVGVSSVQESFRELFRSEFKHRVTSLSRRLGLSEEFVGEYCEHMVHLWKLVEDISNLNRRLEKSFDEDGSSPILQRLNSRKDTIIQLASKLVEVDESIEPASIVEMVENFLVTKHGVKSPSSVTRLNQLVRISLEWIDVLGSESGNFSEFLAKTRTIVAGTCVGVGRWNLGVSNNSYDWVIVDEAARASPSELAVSMQVGKRILLVGDHFQLPPLYKDELRIEMSKRLGVGPDSDIFDSDFERAFESEYGRVVGASLLTQYRMAPAIMKVVSECFYKPRGKLLRQGRPSPPSYYKDLPENLRSEVVWVDTSDAGKDAFEAEYERPDKKEKRNPYEAKLVVDALRQLLTCEAFIDKLSADIKVDEVPIGVVAMYSAQVKEIKRAIAQADWMGEFRALVKVDTVDSYQGKENRIVILSLVRNNPKHRQGFLRSQNRLNVAMSRAMDRLVIIGSSQMWADANPDTPLWNVFHYVSANIFPGEIEIVKSHELRV